MIFCFLLGFWHSCFRDYVFFSLSSCHDQVSIKVKGCSSSQGLRFGALPLMVLGFVQGFIQGNPHMLPNKKTFLKFDGVPMKDWR
jgi:hypothetical protein